MDIIAVIIMNNRSLGRINDGGRRVKNLILIELCPKFRKQPQTYLLTKYLFERGTFLENAYVFED